MLISLLLLHCEKLIFIMVIRNEFGIIDLCVFFFVKHLDWLFSRSSKTNLKYICVLFCYSFYLNWYSQPSQTKFEIDLCFLFTYIVIDFSNYHKQIWNRLVLVWTTFFLLLQGSSMWWVVQICWLIFSWTPLVQELAYGCK